MKTPQCPGCGYAAMQRDENRSETIRHGTDSATVAGLASFPLQAGASVGPTMAGYRMQYFSLGLPLEIAALLQGANAAIYYLFFHAVKPPEEIDDPTPAAANPAAPR